MATLNLADTIDQLVRFGESTSPVWSLYLDCTAAPDGQRTHGARLRALLRESEPLSPGEHAFWSRAAKLSSNYVEYQLPEDAQGLAIFYCESPPLSETIPLPLSTPDRLSISHTPQIDPLIELEASNVSYHVLVLHHLSATLYRYVDRELTLFERLEEEVHAPTSRQTAISQSSLADHSRRLFGAVVSSLARLQAGSPESGLVVLGTDHHRAELRKLLPADLEIVYEHGIPPHRDEGGLANEILYLLGKIEVPVTVADTEMTHELRNRLGQRHRVASGVGSTLFHLQAGNLEHLFLSSRFSGRGSRCERCGFVFGHVRTECTYCGGDTSQVHLRNRIERLAETHNVPFHFVESPSYLDPLGGAAGYLREPGLKKPR